MRNQFGNNNNNMGGGGGGGGGGGVGAHDVPMVHIVPKKDGPSDTEAALKNRFAQLTSQQQQGPQMQGKRCSIDTLIS